ncbi:DUF4192 domain-containing protein [Nonomuraea sp. C10]|uniref:DUF4192 domain-containing protein n=1 Tax=Nonomuraea sp. C10 TaxID=2600577 RepID=UPI0011CDD6BC|nr:DUF4192 domain-containing protein [Nonomuraea sp. C10]TXK39285.1 DUF4192 domain-containing protein [Nonomuraea sp. C10]
MTTDISATCLTLTSPADILAAVPYLVGFHPADSLIVVGLAQSRAKVAARWNVPMPPGTLAPLTALFQREEVSQVVVVGYGPGEAVTPAVDEATAIAAGAGVEVAEALRAHDGRYWSYVCDSATCCPPEGTPYDPRSSRVAAEATVRGLVALPDRQTLQRTIAPATGPVRLAMRRATADAIHTLRTALTTTSGGAVSAVHPVSDGAVSAEAGAYGVEAGAVSDVAVPESASGVPRVSGGAVSASDEFAGVFVAEGLARVRAALARAAAGDRLDDAEAARLGLALAVIRVRDEAWTLMDDSHIALWKDLTRRLEPAFIPPVASLLAMAGWRAGDSILATIALERALAIDPHYSMANLLMHALQHLLPPAVLDGRMPAPDELDAAMGEPRASWLQPLLALIEHHPEPDALHAGDLGPSAFPSDTGSGPGAPDLADEKTT